jgi:hypothetical protein
MILHCLFSSRWLVVKNHCLHRGEPGGGLAQAPSDLLQNHWLHRDKLGGGQSIPSVHPN